VTYIQEHKLNKPVIIGHSLGGYLALRFAIEHPDAAGAIVSVDGYPGYLALNGGNPAEAKTVGQQMRTGMGQMTQEAYEGFVKDGTASRNMVTPDSDFQTLVRWGLASDRSAVADALAEIFGRDLQNELGAIRVPALMLAAWQSYAVYTDHDRHMATLREQFSKLKGVQIELNDTARHFIMWDDPQWMFGHMERFLAAHLQ
jgi:pimeloyl-ACP methyl ester carboxylesterase